MGDHLLAATPSPDMGASPPTVASTSRIEAGASRLLASSKVSTMHEMTDADLDSLAVALARLLAAYWRRQQQAQEEAPHRQEGGRPPDDAHSGSVEIVP